MPLRHGPRVCRVEQWPNLRRQLIRRGPVLEHLGNDLLVGNEVDQTYPAHRTQPLKHLPTELVNLVGYHHWYTGQGSLERGGAGLDQGGIGSGQNRSGVLPDHFEALSVRIDPACRAGHENALAASLTEQAASRFAKRCPQPPDLLVPAAGEDGQGTTVRRDAEPGTSVLPRRPRGTIDQGVSYILAADAKPAEELLLERQYNRQPVYRSSQPASSFRPPGPELGSDVVQHLGAGPVSRFGHTKMKTRVVNQDGQIVPADAEVSLERSKQTIVGPDLGDHLNHSEGGQTLHGVADRGARRFHLRAAQRLDGGTGIAPRERSHDARRMKISGGLAGGDEDARLTPPVHQCVEAASGWVRTASATRSASASAARPSSPRTTTSRWPRTACTKLCSSSASASASGASRTMRSTTSASSRPVPGCQPLRPRMNSPPPLARSSER